jgi:decaprenylphospho-beta-D-erythro-pentofuranosid-2-ulose 2-reductase
MSQARPLPPNAEALVTGTMALFGATSGLAAALAAELLRHGETLVLIGRNEITLKALAEDLLVRCGQRPATFIWDLLERDQHDARMQALLQAHDIGGVIIAAGVLHEEYAIEGDANLARTMMDVNLTETIQVLLRFASHLKARREGLIAAFSSIAGDRGRAKNKTYGASKAGLNVFLEGLRQSLHPFGIRLTVIKPGPVHTPMTADYRGPNFLLAEPTAVAKTIVKGLGKNRRTLYVPSYWRYVMGFLRCWPEALFRFLKA